MLSKDGCPQVSGIAINCFIRFLHIDHTSSSQPILMHGLFKEQ
jgi:hypothetical protein